MSETACLMISLIDVTGSIKHLPLDRQQLAAHPLQVKAISVDGVVPPHPPYIGLGQRDAHVNHLITLGSVGLALLCFALLCFAFHFWLVA